MTTDDEITQLVIDSKKIKVIFAAAILIVVAFAIGTVAYTKGEAHQAKKDDAYVQQFYKTHPINSSPITAPTQN